MAKKKISKTNAIRIIEQHKIPYVETEFEVNEEHLDAITVAQILQVDEKEIYKTLLTVGNVTGPVVAVIPGNCELDLKKLAKVSGNKKIEMLPLKELEATTGYIRGGCSPVGMKKLFPTYIDASAENLEKIFVSAGKRGVQMQLAPQDLCKVVGGKFAELIFN